MFQVIVLVRKSFGEKVEGMTSFREASVFSHSVPTSIFVLSEVALLILPYGLFVAQTGITSVRPRLGPRSFELSVGLRVVVPVGTEGPRAEVPAGRDTPLRVPPRQGQETGPGDGVWSPLGEDRVSPKTRPRVAPVVSVVTGERFHGSDHRPPRVHGLDGFQKVPVIVPTLASRLSMYGSLVNPTHGPTLTKYQENKKSWFNTDPTSHSCKVILTSTVQRGTNTIRIF